jgi:hypothetical protein
MFQVEICNVVEVTRISRVYVHLRPNLLHEVVRNYSTKYLFPLLEVWQAFYCLNHHIRTFVFSPLASKSGEKVSDSNDSNDRLPAYLERTEQALIHTHNCACVIKLSTVIRRAKYCN